MLNILSAGGHVRFVNEGTVYGPLQNRPLEKALPGPGVQDQAEPQAKSGPPTPTPPTCTPPSSRRWEEHFGHPEGTGKQLCPQGFKGLLPNADHTSSLRGSPL